MSIHIPFIVQPNFSHGSDYRYYHNVFTPAECEKIKATGLSGLDKSKLMGDAINEKLRNSHNSWIENNENNVWIYEKLHQILLDANAYYNYSITHFGEALQFTQYAPGQYYHWHCDNSHNGPTSMRKMTMVTHLTNELTYEGGDLQLFSCRNEKIPKTQGTVIVFPSYKEHRVIPVKSGTRHSLVAWVSGPPLR
jgi:predicted 2-oxoglutarate/Fe(II)-dependent dioxygenase YbiX